MPRPGHHGIYSNRAVGHVYAGCPAAYCGRYGVLSRIDFNNRLHCRNVWWVEDGENTEVMFSRRRDGVWRAFPGPADGPGLIYLDPLVNGANDV